MCQVLQLVDHNFLLGELLGYLQDIHQEIQAADHQGILGGFQGNRVGRQGNPDDYRGSLDLPDCHRGIRVVVHQGNQDQLGYHRGNLAVHQGSQDLQDYPGIRGDFQDSRGSPDCRDSRVLMVVQRVV